MGAAPPTDRRPRRTLYRYVAREAATPTLISLLGLVAVVLSKEVVGFLPLMNRGVELSTLASIALFKAVPLGAKMLPFAVLVGTLVALGRMGADREILVLEASGVAAPRLVWPVVAFAGAMTLLALALSLSLAPLAGRAQDRVLERISRERPWAQIRAGAVNSFGGWQLEAREVDGDGERMRGVLLWMPEIGDTVFARGARIDAGADGSAQITLIDGAVLPTARGSARQLRFDEVTTVLPRSEQSVTRSDAERLGSLSLRQLATRAADFQPGETTSLNRAALELHRRLALPLATLVFGFVAVPLFLLRTSFSRAGGGVMGILATVAYYGLVQLGEGLVQRGDLGAGAGAWLPNAILALLAAVLLWRASREGVLGHAFDRPQRPPRRSAPGEEGRRRRPRPWALPRYVARLFMGLTALSFAVIFVAYLLIDVMERLDWFGRYHATGGEVVRFYAARVWLLASRAVPMALLVGTSLTVSFLAADGELIGMRACGIPAPRALLPAMILSALVAPLYFALNNVVVPRTNALADLLKQTEIKDLPRGQRTAGVWYRSGNQVVEAALFDTQHGAARDITIYELGETGHPHSRTDARLARHQGGGRWRLREAARIEVTGEGRLLRVEPPKYAQLGEALPAEVDTMHFSVGELRQLIAEVEGDGFDATELRVDFHVKLAEPLACLVLPAAILFFAVGGPPFPGSAQTLLASAVLGVSYILLTGVAATIGYSGKIAPALAAWSPTAVYGLLAGFFGWRLWRRL